MDKNDAWTQDPSLSGIDPAKLEALKQMAEQGSRMKQAELIPFLMAAASGNRGGSASFSSAEADLILNVIRQGKSPEEQAKIDRMVRLVGAMRRR